MTNKNIARLYNVEGDVYAICIYPDINSHGKYIMSNGEFDGTYILPRKEWRFNSRREAIQILKKYFHCKRISVKRWDTLDNIYEVTKKGW